MVRDLQQQLELKDEVIRKMAEEQRVLDARLARSAAAEHSAGLDASPMAHAVASPPTAGERGGGGADGDGSRGVSETWTLGGYISSLGFSHDLADAMLSASKQTSDGGGWSLFGGSDGGGGDGGRVDELRFVRELAKRCPDASAGRRAISELLSRGGALERLADKMWSGLEQLCVADAATGAELQNKFLQEGAGMLSYGGGRRESPAALTVLRSLPPSDPNCAKRAARISTCVPTSTWPRPRSNPTLTWVHPSPLTLAHAAATPPQV